MRRKKDIAVILEHEEARLDRIRLLCEAAAGTDDVSGSLQLEIKGYFENLRSVLDYLAHEVREACCDPLEEKKKRSFGFPIANNESHFKSKMKSIFPGLDQNHPSIYSYLDSIQPYRRNPWLSHFRNINNKNKHEELAKHQRLKAVAGSPEEKELGPIVFLLDKGDDPDSFVGATWASLKFTDGEVSILLLLMQSLTGVREIEYELTLLLGSVRRPTPASSGHLGSRPGAR